MNANNDYKSKYQLIELLLQSVIHQLIYFAMLKKE